MGQKSEITAANIFLQFKHKMSSETEIQLQRL